MALDRSALLEVLDALRPADAGERITQAAETIYQALIDAELTAFIGASPHERTETRSNQRNGSRPRTLSTVAGDLELRIPFQVWRNFGGPAIGPKTDTRWTERVDMIRR